jgi:hypothetical protein
MHCIQGLDPGENRMIRLTCSTSLLTLLCLAPPVPADDAPCSHEPVLVHGQELYRSCHCEALEYPEIEAALEAYGIRVEPSAPVGAEGFFDCGITLRWERERPDEIERCVKTKLEALDKVDSIRDLPQNLLHLKCSEIFFADACIAEGGAFPCASAQREATKRGMTELAAKLKQVKCDHCRGLGNDWKKCLDCDGMLDFLRQACESGDGFRQSKACSALRSKG